MQLQLSATLTHNTVNFTYTHKIMCCLLLTQSDLTNIWQVHFADSTACPCELSVGNLNRSKHSYNVTSKWQWHCAINCTATSDCHSGIFSLCLECTACCTMRERSETVAIWKLRTLRMEAERGSCPCVRRQTMISMYCWYGGKTKDTESNFKQWSVKHERETAHMKLLNCMKAIKLGNPRKYLFYIT
jgi:hypothetical protein